MRFFVGSALALLGMGSVDLSAISTSWVRFEQYVNEFGKTYKDKDEQKHRFMAFLENEEEVAKLNAIEGKAIFGLTKFSDLTKEEFKQYLNFKQYDNEKRKQVPVQKAKNATADSYDWRDHNGVTAVKDQGQCGSCWAFSATETVESAYLVKNGDEASILLSEQQLVSCDTGDGGCNGGDLPSAFNYVKGAGGIASESSYPYTSGGGDSGTCESFSVVANTKPTSYAYATPACYDSYSCDSQDEGSLAKNLETVGPIGICVNAANWQYYVGGVMSASTCGGNGYYDLDHCVQLVGYYDIGSSDGYWMVRNSWAADWGEAGYIYLAYGSNTCGVADEAMFVRL